MMDIEISCKGHCDSFSHFLYLVSYTVKDNRFCTDARLTVVFAVGGNAKKPFVSVASSFQAPLQATT